MTWLIAIGLALGAFAAAVLAFRVPRSGWTTVAAALALGLAGYALQASPGLPGAPAMSAAETGDAAWALVEERKSMVAEDERSRSNRLIVADGFARRGRYTDAATILRGAIAEHPRDAEVWLALGNALIEHADGALTEPALLAYRRAAELDPDGVGPGYFLGLALI
ncbi:MAG TPA: tetratricopeptide repeat protein, partial [Croceibacterium sp.]